MIFLKLLKRWRKMFFGKSIFHVQQKAGLLYSKKTIKGYYNDLTQKVLGNPVLDNNGIPLTTTISGITGYFPIVIFQYGLGLYDLYLKTQDSSYLKKFIKIANWAVKDIDSSGRWSCMDRIGDSKHLPQSSMCQGEGISVLVRAYKATGVKKYAEVAKKAAEFMIKDIKLGGTCYYGDNQVVFQEYVDHNEHTSVLNGWIFSIFGIYDFVLLTDNKKYKKIMVSTVDSLARLLDSYDRKFWSNYDKKNTIASPSYHALHIEQLKVLYDLFNNESFMLYQKKWESYQSRKLYKTIAMIIKLFQKIRPNKFYDISTSTVN